jgi:hypothetical protein
MLAAIWGVNGFHLVDLMPFEWAFNTQYFMEHVMAPLIQTVFPQGRTRYAPRLKIHLDNCRVHFSKVMELFFVENQLQHVPHPIYSPDLTASDFWLFARIKTGPTGRNFASPKNY